MASAAVNSVPLHLKKKKSTLNAFIYSSNAYCLIFALLSYTSTQKMEAVFSSETSACSTKLHSFMFQKMIHFKDEGKRFLPLIKHYAMKTYGRVDV
jgi:hypothetical protein